MCIVGVPAGTRLENTGLDNPTVADCTLLA